LSWFTISDSESRAAVAGVAAPWSAAEPTGLPFSIATAVITDQTAALDIASA
jgi:hypothetical protein